MLNKKGVSGIIATVILIALVMIAGSLVWSFVKNLIDDKLEGAGSCLDTLEKVSLNPEYTCYDSDLNKIVFSVNRANVNITGIVVSIAGEGTSKTFTFDVDGATPSEGLTSYSIGGDLTMPNNNEGKTYVYALATFIPDSVEIAPIISGKQCSATDKINTMLTCAEQGISI